MALQSMTGFSRAQGSVSLPQGGEAHWVWEIRSVNGKGLDFRLRLPPGLESIENDCRKLAAGAFSRGNLQASLQYDKRNSTALPVVNEAALAAILTHVERLRIELGSLPPAAETILSMKGVLEIAETGESEEAVEIRNAALLAGLDQALRELVVMRSSEGRAIAQVLVGHVAEIARLTAAVEVDPSPPSLRTGRVVWSGAVLSCAPTQEVLVEARDDARRRSHSGPPVPGEPIRIRRVRRDARNGPGASAVTTCTSLHRSRAHPHRRANADRSATR